MAGITLAQAQEQLDAALSIQATGMLSMSINGRSYTYRSMKDLLEAITFWERKVNQLQRVTAGGARTDFAAADLSSSR